MAMPPSGFLCLGGGFLLLDLLRRKFKRRRRPSASSSDQDVEEHENIDATQQSEDGVSERSISHGGLDNEEPYKMLYNMEPAIISTSDPDGQSSGTDFFMKAGLPGSEADCPLRQVEEHENIDATQQPEDGVSERSISHGGLDNEEPYKMLYHLDPSIIAMSFSDSQSSGIDFFMKAGLPGSEADCPLIQWLQQREVNGIKPLTTFETRGMPTQTYIRDEIKVLIKSLVQFVQYLHSQGQCASGGTFRAKNISVVGGNLRFHKLELSSLTEKLRQENYNSIEGMIMTVILREKAKHLPQDMQHFLKLLKNPRYHHVYNIYEELDVRVRCTPRQSASSSDQDVVEFHQNIDGVLEQTISHGGLDNEEPYKMLYNLEPAIISTSDPDGQSSGTDFFIKAGLPGSEADCPLIQWLQRREDDGIKPLATFKIRGMPRQTYIRDEIKVLTKSLVQFVQDLHIQGQCASGGTFRAKNISVVGGNLRFHNLELGSLTEKLRQENYNSIECMIMSVILREKAKQLPQDMQHFLKLLKNPRPHIYLISNHVALMNLRSCLNLYQLLWDKKKAMNPTACSKWKNAIQDLDIYCWSKSISKESPLFNVYKHRKYQGGNKVHLINFCRNAAAHLSEQSNRGELFQFEHISLIITASFPTLLADLQEKLHHHGILEEFV